MIDRFKKYIGKVKNIWPKKNRSKEKTSGKSLTRPRIPSKYTGPLKKGFSSVFAFLKKIGKKIRSPSPRGRQWQIFFLVLFILFFAANLVAPTYWNQGVDFLNEKQDYVNLPQFYQKDFKYGFDLSGGITLVYKANFEENTEKDIDQSLENIRDVIEKRVNLFGVSEAEVRIIKIGQDQGISVSLPGITDKEQAINTIGQTPTIDFREEKTEEEKQETIDILTLQNPDLELTKEMLTYYGLDFKQTELGGKNIKSAGVGYDQVSGEPEVLLAFDNEGKALFAELTGRNVGKRIGIYLDGQPISVPVVQEKIDSDQAVISGLTEEEAQSLKKRLNAGALPVQIEILEQRSVGPALGKNVLDKIFTAGVWGALAVVIFMIIIYRLPGLIASVSLAIYTVLLLSLFKLMGITMTLSGIAGVVFSIGIAVDANVLIFERMREELKLKHDLAASIEEGFNKAWTSIRDSNISTLIICLILFFAGVGIMRGFAITLALGILVSMFSAVSVTRVILRLIAPKLKNEIIKKYLF